MLPGPCDEAASCMSSSPDVILCQPLPGWIDATSRPRGANDEPRAFTTSYLFNTRAALRAGRATRRRPARLTYLLVGQVRPRPRSGSRGTGPGGAACCWRSCANYLLISVFFPGQPQRADVSYTFFKQQVDAENVAEISSRARHDPGHLPSGRGLSAGRWRCGEDGPGLLDGAAGVRRPRPRDAAQRARRRHQRQAGRRAAQSAADPAAQLRPDDCC